MSQSRAWPGSVWSNSELRVSGRSAALDRSDRVLQFKVLRNPHTQSSDSRLSRTPSSVWISRSTERGARGGRGGELGAGRLCCQKGAAAAWRTQGSGPSGQNRKEGAPGAHVTLSWGSTGASCGVTQRCCPPSCPENVQMWLRVLHRPGRLHCAWPRDADSGADPAPEIAPVVGGCPGLSRWSQEA